MGESLHHGMFHQVNGPIHPENGGLQMYEEVALTGTTILQLPTSEP